MYIGRVATPNGADCRTGDNILGAAQQDVSINLPAMAPSGYYLALRIGFAFPKEEVNALPPSWVDQYTRESFLLADPVLRWLYDDVGLCRWSALPFPDPRGVLAAARGHGLVFGLAVSIRHDGPGRQRSFGTFARPDREYSDSEAAALHAHVLARHEALVPPRNITKAEIEALRLIKDGQRLKQIAFRLGVTEGAVKQRLKNARVKLDAKTGAEAISRAVAFGLI